jgi:AraC-like DNA-binding protein
VRVATQRVGSFAGLPMLVRQLGVDPVEILCNANLMPDVLDDPERRVSYAGLGRFLRQAADLAACPQLGLLSGRMGQLSDFGLLGDVVRNSPTVGAALRTLVRHHHLHSEGGLAFLIERGPMVDFGYAIYEQEFEAPDVMYDAAMATSINVLRELCGPGWTPSEVLLPHARPLDVTPYRKLFKQPRFDAEFCALRFPAHWMMNVVEGADAAKLRIAGEQVACVSSGDLLQQSRRAMREMLLHDKHSGEDLAKRMAMHRRTLNRRLKAEGTTFQHLLDSVRYTVACELLATSAISLDDVAATLGYAAVSPFMRAFARWSGTTPGHWRRSLVSATQSVCVDWRRPDSERAIVPPVAEAIIPATAPPRFSSQGAR